MVNIELKKKNQIQIHTIILLSFIPKDRGQHLNLISIDHDNQNCIKEANWLRIGNFWLPHEMCKLVSKFWDRFDFCSKISKFSF